MLHPLLPIRIAPAIKFLALASRRDDHPPAECGLPYLFPVPCSGLQRPSPSVPKFEGGSKSLLGIAANLPTHRFLRESHKKLTWLCPVSNTGNPVGRTPSDIGNLDLVAGRTHLREVGSLVQECVHRFH